MKIAIFGGSFDPPHLGHYEILKKAYDNLDVDRIYVVVSYLNPFKIKSRCTPQDRLTWITILINSIDKDNKKLFISDYEIMQKKQTPSIKTVLHFKKTLNPSEIFFIIGEDNLSSLKRWNHFKILNSLATFIVFKRPNSIKADTTGINLRFIDMNCFISSTNIINNLEEHLNDIPKQILQSVYNTLQRTNMNEALSLSNLVKNIESILDSKKAEDIEVIDMREKQYLSQYVVVASALAQKHALSLLNSLKQELKPNEVSFYAIDDSSQDWIIIDLGEVMVHIFTKENRQKYNIEDFLLKEFAKI